jgi:DNA-binding IclR family transcriptional regulator
VTPAEIAEAIGKSGGSVRMLLSKMRRSGDITKDADDRYRATPL